MKINFVGLSCFLVENAAGYRILVDPFDDSPDWILGPLFPKEFNGKPFGTNLLLVSETDSDHTRDVAGFQQNAPQIAVNRNPFPNLDLRGTVVYEFNGEPCIAWHYTVDGIRLAHFSDHAHILNEDQLKELGHPDIIFYPLPKVEWEQQEFIDIVRENIRKLNPKLVIWAHHITPKHMPSFDDTDALRKFFVQYFVQNTSTSKLYKGEGSFMQLCWMLESGLQLTREYNGHIIDSTVFEIDQASLQQYKQPTPILFTQMLAPSKTD